MQKYNLFVVLRGQLQLLIEELGEKALVSLKPGESFIIKPGQWHEFRGVTETEAIEEMYVEYDEGDIERKIIGGEIG